MIALSDNPDDGGCLGRRIAQFSGVIRSTCSETSYKLHLKKVFKVCRSKYVFVCVCTV